MRNKIDFIICELNYLFTKICSASAKASEVLSTTPAQAPSTTTTATITEELSSWTRTKKTTSNDSQYDEQISNTTALPVIAPPAPFPFLRPGNQKASKQVRSRVQPKSEKPNQNLYSNQCACSPVDSNHGDLHRQRENRLQNSSAASSTTTTTTTNTSNATTPRAATSSCSASGESPFQTKPSPLPPQRKAKS